MTDDATLAAQRRLLARREALLGTVGATTAPAFLAGVPGPSGSLLRAAGERLAAAPRASDGAAALQQFGAALSGALDALAIRCGALGLGGPGGAAFGALAAWEGHPLEPQLLAALDAGVHLFMVFGPSRPSRVALFARTALLVRARAGGPARGAWADEVVDALDHPYDATRRALGDAVRRDRVVVVQGIGDRPGPAARLCELVAARSDMGLATVLSGDATSEPFAALYRDPLAGSLGGRGEVLWCET